MTTSGIKNISKVHFCEIRDDQGLPSLKKCHVCKSGIAFLSYQSHREFQPYRSGVISKESGSITLDELEVFDKVFKMLSECSLATLFFYSGRLNRLKQRVAHVHPFNFLESFKDNPTLKKKFLKVVDKGGLVWKECFSRFKENLNLQNSYKNIGPHIDSFSRKTKIDPDVVKEFLEKDELSTQDIHNLVLSIAS